MCIRLIIIWVYPTYGHLGYWTIRIHISIHQRQSFLAYPWPFWYSRGRGRPPWKGPPQKKSQPLKKTNELKEPYAVTHSTSKSATNQYSRQMFQSFLNLHVSGFLVEKRHQTTVSDLGPAVGKSSQMKFAFWKTPPKFIIQGGRPTSCNLSYNPY